MHTAHCTLHTAREQKTPFGALIPVTKFGITANFWGKTRLFWDSRHSVALKKPATAYAKILQRDGINSIYIYNNQYFYILLTMYLPMSHAVVRARVDTKNSKRVLRAKQFCPTNFFCAALRDIFHGTWGSGI